MALSPTKAPPMQCPPYPSLQCTPETVRPPASRQASQNSHPAPDSKHSTILSLRPPNNLPPLSPHPLPPDPHTLRNTRPTLSPLHRLFPSPCPHRSLILILILYLPFLLPVFLLLPRTHPPRRLINKTLITRLHHPLHQIRQRLEMPRIALQAGMSLTLPASTGGLRPRPSVGCDARRR